MKHELRAPLRDRLAEPNEQARLEAIRARLRVSRGMPAARTAIPVGLGMALAAVAVFAILARSAPTPEERTAPRSDTAAVDLHDVAPSPSSPISPASAVSPSPGRIAREDGESFDAMRGGREGRRVTLDDGSSLLLARDASVDVVENGGEHLVLAQGPGRVTYDVRPGGPRQWIIDAGLATIDVLGTSFVIERSSERVRVEVLRGHVRVRSERALETLGTGESVTIDAPAVVAPAVVAPVIAVAPAPSVPVRRTRRAGASAWRSLAERGDSEQAFAAIGATGWDATVEDADASELWALADLARASGHPLLARAPLRRFAEAYASDPRAGAASLTLGRLELDALGTPHDAVTALERARSLGVPHGQRGILEARLAEAYRRADRAADARIAAERYLALEPHGVSASDMRALLAEAP